MTDYTVQPGDCMSSVAYDHGFFWQTLWDLPDNAALKSSRKDPNVLLAGDVVHIPDLRMKRAPTPAGARHVFKVKGIPARLRMTFHFLGEPRAGDRYTLKTRDTLLTGTLDGTGTIDVPIPPNADQLKLTLGDDEAEYNFVLGSLDPITEVSGARQRLTNLGFPCGTDGGDDAATAIAKAVEAFQETAQLPLTGVLDDGTLAKLKDAHGM